MADYLWPFPMNWRDSLEVSYSFSTDIFLSSSGLETRRSVRSEPRKVISFTCSPRKSELQRYNLFMASAQNSRVIVPEFNLVAFSRLVLEPGEDRINISGPVPFWMLAGNDVILNSKRVHKIVEVGADYIRVDPRADLRMEIGGSITHGVTCNFANDIQASRLTSNAASARMRFEAEPGLEVFGTGRGSLDRWAGEYLFPMKHNWASGQEVGNSWPTEKVDFDFGRIKTFKLVKFPSVSKQCSFLFKDYADHRRLVEFFLAMKGRRGSFIRSTQEDDVKLTSDIVANSTSLRCQVDLTNVLSTSLLIRAVEIKKGSLFHRSEIALVRPGEIVLKDPVPFGGAVDRVSWLFRSRLDSDDLSMSWITTRLCQGSLPTRSLPFDASQDLYEYRRTTDNDIRDTTNDDRRVVLYL